LINLSQAVQLNQQYRWTQEELNDIVIDAIQDIKGKHIVKLDLRRIGDAPTDFFIICEGDSNTQVKAIADNISKRLKEELGVFPSNIEGTGASNWVCLDYFNTVIHVFYRETRAFYELEDLWSDAQFTEYETL
jgi:ribosome-associated protein